MTRALAVAIGVALMVPAVAVAEPRVAIVQFEGDKKGALRKVVAGLIEDDVSLVSPKTVSRAMDELELDVDMSTKQLKKLARELEADVIIRGSLSPKGSRKLLHLRWFANGKRVRGFKVEFASAKSGKFKSALRDKLLDKLADAGTGKKKTTKKKKARPEEAEEDVEDEPVVRAKAKRKGKKSRSEDDEDDEQVARKGKRKKSAPDEDDAEGGGDDDDRGSGDDDEGPNEDGKRVSAAGENDDDIDSELRGGVEVGGRTAGVRTLNRAAVRVDFGPSFTSRSLRFSSRAFEEAPRPYSNPPVPGGRVEGAIYPLAFSKPGTILGGIGLAAEYDQTVGLNVQSTVQPGTKFPVTQKHLAIGARLRIVIGKKPTSPSVTLGGGYMSRTFQVDRSQLAEGNMIDLPDVGYKGYSGGLDVRFPIMPSVALVAGGGAIFVTTTGAIQTAAQYGQAKVTGAEGQAGVDIGIGKHMVVRLIGELTQMGFAFTGTGQMSNNRDGDPTTIDVGGAADRYLGATLTFGVHY